MPNGASVMTNMVLNPKASPKDPSLQKLPPQSIEAEESILSAILLDNNTLLDVLEIIVADDFYRTAHQRIFVAINELFTKAEPVDLVTLTNLLRDKNLLEEIVINYVTLCYQLAIFDEINRVLAGDLSGVESGKAEEGFTGHVGAQPVEMIVLVEIPEVLFLLPDADDGF